jgi:hypothetical protein
MIGLDVIAPMFCGTEQDSYFMRVTRPGECTTHERELAMALTGLIIARRIGVALTASTGEGA